MASGTAVQVTNTLVMGNDPSGQNGSVWVGSGSVLRDVTIQGNAATALVGAGITRINVQMNGAGGSGAHLVPGQTSGATIAAALPPTPPALKNLRVFSLP